MSSSINRWRSGVMGGSFGCWDKAQHHHYPKEKRDPRDKPKKTDHQITMTGLTNTNFPIKSKNPGLPRSGLVQRIEFTGVCRQANVRCNDLLGPLLRPEILIIWIRRLRRFDVVTYLYLCAHWITRSQFTQNSGGRLAIHEFNIALIHLPIN